MHPKDLNIQRKTVYHLLGLTDSSLYRWDHGRERQITHLQIDTFKNEDFASSSNGYPIVSIWILHLQQQNKFYFNLAWNTKKTSLIEIPDSSNVNFINILSAAFTLIDPKSIKRLTTWLSFLRFWDLRI